VGAIKFIAIAPAGSISSRVTTGKVTLAVLFPVVCEKRWEEMINVIRKTNL
jgi:hypothetical protein